MANILQTTYSILLNQMFDILFQISLKFFLKGPIDSKSVVVQVKAWHRKGDKPWC